MKGCSQEAKDVAKKRMVAEGSKSKKGSSDFFILLKT
jgi:hypothetical protein